MKKIIFFILSVFIVSNTFPQYTVTKVIGSVRNKYNNELLKPGSKFRDTTVLYFSTSKDMVRAIVAGEGIYIITPSPDAQKQGNNLLEIVKFALHIKSKEGNLSGRGADAKLIPENLQTGYTLNKKNIICSENKYLFNPDVYNIANGNKFFLQTEIDGNKPMIKSLQTHGDTLILYSADFKIYDAADSGNVKYKLGFYSNDNNNSSLLANIYPYFDSLKEMENIMKIIIENGGQKEKDKLREECYAEVYEAMGLPSELVFKSDFDKIFTSYEQAAINNK